MFMFFSKLENITNLAEMQIIILKSHPPMPISHLGKIIFNWRKRLKRRNRVLWV
jgi:hypothetical protein